MIPKPTVKLRKSAVVEFSPSGRLLAQVTSKAILWDLSSRKVVSQLKLIRNESYVRFSPDERVLAIKNTNGELVFCEHSTGEVISSTGRFSANRSGSDPAFSPDGNYLFDGDSYGTLRRIDIRTANEVESHGFGFGYMSGGCLTDPNSGTTIAVLNAKSGTPGGSKILLYQPGQPLASPTVLKPASRAQSQDGGWRFIERPVLHPSGKGFAFVLGRADKSSPSTIEAIDLDGRSLTSIRLPSPMHFAQGLGWSRNGILCAAVHENKHEPGMSFTAWRELRDSNVFEHVNFYSDSTGTFLEQWPWRNAWGIAFSPADDSLAIGGSGDGSAMFSPSPVVSPNSPLFE